MMNTLYHNINVDNEELLAEEACGLALTSTCEFIKQLFVTSKKIYWSKSNVIRKISSW